MNMNSKENAQFSAKTVDIVVNLVWDKGILPLCYQKHPQWSPIITIYLKNKKIIYTYCVMYIHICTLSWPVMMY